MIGNPPYGANLSDKNKEFFKLMYAKVHMRTPDTFNYFIAKAFDLLKDTGEISFIVPSNLLFQNEYEKTRGFLINEHTLNRVINAGDNVFKHASVPTCVFVAQNIHEDNYEIRYSDMRNGYKNSREWNNYITRISSLKVLNTPSYIIGVSDESASILDKVKEKSILIHDIADDVSAGISRTGPMMYAEPKRNYGQRRLILTLPPMRLSMENWNNTGLPTGPISNARRLLKRRCGNILMGCTLTKMPPKV